MHSSAIKLIISVKKNIALFQKNLYLASTNVVSEIRGSWKFSQKILLIKNGDISNHTLLQMANGRMDFSKLFLLLKKAQKIA